MEIPLLSRIEDRSAHVAVIGLGYVGLHVAVAFTEAGFPVTGIEVDARKVESVQRGESYVTGVSSERLARLVRQPVGVPVSGFGGAGEWPRGRTLTATTDYAVLDDVDVAIICVPTPLSKTKDPDISYIIDATERLSQHVHPGMLVVLESTTYPGTTEEVLLPRLERGGLRVGEDFYLGFSPERIDPGNQDYTLRNTPKVVSGVTPTCLKVARALYETIVDQVVPVSSTATAEMVKLLENTFRAVNIALVNEVALMCDRLGLNVWEVIDAAATKPYGFMKFMPGPGLGGHCIPIDSHYLAWKLKLLNYNARFVQLASEINAFMPYYVAGKVSDALNDERKPVKGSRVLILGMAYKPDVADARESPALDIMQLLEAKGAEVHYHDPLIPYVHLEDSVRTSIELTAEVLAAADCVIIVTNHSAYDWQWVLDHAWLVVDTRNATAGVQGRARVVRL